DLLRQHGYVNVYAGVGVPNIKSEKFHLAVGFYEVGYFKKIGYKFGSWHDTRWFQLHLVEHPDVSAQLKTSAEMENNPEFIAILKRANEKFADIS
ncbi:MAG: GNAT family N-acetyltransferase, partial [Chitinophagaceae bacterium]